MLMNAREQDRQAFIASIMAGARPAYRVTVEGKPDRFALLQPHATVHAQLRIQDHAGELFDVRLVA